jgi:N-acetylglucosamine transport system permease protein
MAVMTQTSDSVSPPARPKLRPMGPTVGQRALNVGAHSFLVFWAAMVVIPLAWVFLSAFKDDSQIIRDPLSFFPKSLHWDNFARAWSKGHIGDYLGNTVLILAFGVTLTMLFGSMAAYVLARFEFWGNRLIYYMFVAGLTLPVFMAAVPLYTNTLEMDDQFPLLGINSRVMLVLVYIAWSLSFTVFFMHAFFRTLDSSVAEAALVDGASHTRTFFQVMLPMARPGLISIGIFNIIGQWNQWYLPTVVMNPSGGETAHKVLAQGLLDLSLSQGYKSDWSGMFAGLTLAMLPVIAVYTVFQRQVQAGLSVSITK